MRKVLSSFTFYFLMLSVALIFSHYNGQDPKGIVLVGFNPILSQFSSDMRLWNFINSGPMVDCNTMSGTISIYWYFAHFISFALYGAIFDLLKFVINRYISPQVNVTES